MDAGAGQPGGLQLADPLSDPRRRPRCPPVQDGPELRGLPRARRRLRRVDGHRDRQHAAGPGTRHHAAARSRAPGDPPARRPDRRQPRDQPLLGADQALSVVVRPRRTPHAGVEVSSRNPGPDRPGLSPDAGLHAERVFAALPHHGRLRRSPRWARMVRMVRARLHDDGSDAPADLQHRHRRDHPDPCRDGGAAGSDHRGGRSGSPAVRKPRGTPGRLRKRPDLRRGRAAHAVRLGCPAADSRSARSRPSASNRCRRATRRRRPMALESACST